MERRKRGNCNKPDRRYKGDGCLEFDDERPPPGLKGKALGLWYRDNRKNKTKKPEEDRLPVITLPRYKFEKIEVLLARCKEKQNGRMMESKFKADFLDKIDGSFQEDMEKMMNVDFAASARSSVAKKSFRCPEMEEFRKKLPCYHMKNEIMDKIRGNQIVVISGETGCGKTTQIVQYVLDEAIDNCQKCNIVCTQPRRISAIAVAERVAAERNENIGRSVGYQIRLERVMTSVPDGTIMFLTTGILLQWLQDNPLLNGVTHLFIDEVHERDILSDFVLACLKQIIKKRVDLKLVLMSATLNAERFSSYFGEVPCVHIPGFTFPVEEIYLEQILGMTNFSYAGKGFQKHGKHFDLDPAARSNIKALEKGGVISKRVAEELVRADSEKFNADLIACLVSNICSQEEEGAILIFVPGISEINQVIRSLKYKRIYGSDYLIVPLHSTLPNINQRIVFKTPQRGVRKIVISTNIAETSITIDDVVFVIDCGFIKIKMYDKKLNITSLGSDWISVSNARQRKGRAGRTRAGKCYKLYTSYREQLFEHYPLPEIQRTRLDEVILKVKMLKLGKAEEFLSTVLDPPDSKTVHVSIEVLKYLNALDDNEQLTPLGFHLAKLPLDPQIGKMLLMSAIFGCVDPIMSIAACLSFKDPFSAPLEKQHLLNNAKMELAGRHRSDHYVYYAAIRGWEEAVKRKDHRMFASNYFLSESTLRLLCDMKIQFARHLHDMEFLRTPNPKDENGNHNSENLELVKAIVCAGLYPNVALVKKTTKHDVILKTMEHQKVLMHKRSICSRCSYFESPFLVYHMMLQTTNIFLHDATMISPWALLFFGKTLDIVEFDGVSGIRVDDLIKINCFRKTGMLIQKLRQRLDGLLSNAIANPGVIDWIEEKPLVLQAIVELITTAAEELDKIFRK